MISLKMFRMFVYTLQPLGHYYLNPIATPYAGPVNVKDSEMQI